MVVENGGLLGGLGPDALAALFRASKPIWTCKFDYVYRGSEDAYTIEQVLADMERKGQLAVSRGDLVDIDDLPSCLEHVFGDLPRVTAPPSSRIKRTSGGLRSRQPWPIALAMGWSRPPRPENSGTFIPIQGRGLWTSPTA